MYVAQKSHAEAILSHSLAISQNNSQNIWKCAGGVYLHRKLDIYEKD